jgi:hypothetical protein
MSIATSPEKTMEMEGTSVAEVKSEGMRTSSKRPINISDISDTSESEDERMFPGTKSLLKQSKGMASLLH